MVNNEEKAKRLFSKIKDERVREFLNVLTKSMDDKVERCYAVTSEFKYVLPNGGRCSFYIRPSSTRIDIYLEKFLPADIEIKNRPGNLPLTVKENTSNPKDQFKSVIRVDGEWLAKHEDRKEDLLVFINRLVDDIAGYYC